MFGGGTPRPAAAMPGVAGGVAQGSAIAAGGLAAQKPAQTGGKNMGGTLLALALGGGAVGLQMLLRRGNTDTAAAAGTPSPASLEAQQGLTLAPPSFVPPPDTFQLPVFEVPLAGVTFPSANSTRDALVPRVTGVNNKINLYGVKPRVIGEFDLKPPLGAQPVELIEGDQSTGLYLFCFGYGELDISKVKIGDDDIGDVDGVEHRFVTDPADLHWYTQDIEPKEVGKDLPTGTYVIQKVPQPDSKQVAIDIDFPYGLFTLDSEFNVVNTTCTFSLECRAYNSNDSWTDMGGFNITAGTTAPIRRNATVDLPLTGDLEVRVSKVSAEAYNVAVWAVIRGIKMTPPFQIPKDSLGNPVLMHWMEMKVTASDLTNGNINQVHALCKSKLWTWSGGVWQVPTLTNNASWGLVEVLTGQSSNSVLPREKLDGQSFLDAAAHCDLYGITYNDVFDTATTVIEAARAILALMGASLIVKDGLLSVVIDNKKTQVVQQFSRVNSWGISGKLRNNMKVPDYYRVWYINPDSDWQQDEERVYKDGKTAATAKTWETVLAKGCTSRELAHKFGRLKLARATLRRRTYVWYSMLDHIACRRGSLVTLTHDVVKHGICSGRIVGIVTDGSNNRTQITVSNLCPMAAGKQYGVRIVTTNGTIIKQAVVTSEGNDNDTLTFTTPVAAPNVRVGDHFVFGELGLECRELIIDSIEHQPGHVARLTGIPHAPGIYDALTGPIPPPTSSIDNVPNVMKPVPKPVPWNIQSGENVLTRDWDGAYITRIRVMIVLPTATALREWQYQVKLVGTTEWQAARSQAVNTTGELSIFGVEDTKTYDVRIKAISADFRESEWYTFQHTVIGKSTKPPKPDSVYIIDKNLLVRVTTLPVDFAGYRVKINRGANNTWSAATVFVDLSTSNIIDISTLPGGPMTIMVATVDVAGNESEPAVVQKDFGDIPTSNVIITQQYAPTFTDCTISGGSIVGGQVVADAQTNPLWSADGSTKLWSLNSSDLLWPTLYSALTLTLPPYTPPIDLAGKEFQLLLAVQMQAESAVIEYKGDGQSLLWNIAPNADNNPLWLKADSDLLWTEDPWILWTGSIPGSIQKFQARIRCAESRVFQSVITSVAWIIDVPDVIEIVKNYLIDNAAGKRLSLSKVFAEIYSVTPTLQWDAAYPNAATVGYLDKDISGPLIQIKDTALSGTTGIVTVEVRGR